MRKLVVLVVLVALLAVGVFVLFEFLKEEPSLEKEAPVTAFDEGLSPAAEPPVRDDESDVSRARRRVLRSMLEAAKKGKWFSAREPEGGNDRVFVGPCETVVDEDGDGRPEETISRTYDESGKVVEEKTVTASGEETVEVFERDDWGEISAIRKNDVLSFSRTMEYDESGDPTAVRADFQGDGETDLLEKKFYDEGGRLIEQVDYVKGGVPMTRAVFSYGAEDRLSSYLVYPFTGPGAPHVDPIVTFEFSYDEDGRLLSRRQGGKSRSETKYSYNQDGYLETEAEYKDGSEVASRKRTYTYDDAGNRLSEEVDEDGDGSPENTKMFNYDCWR